MGEPLNDEQLLGASAILLHQQGDAEAAGLLAEEQTSLETTLWDTEFGRAGYRAVLRAEPHLLPRFTEEVLERISVALSAAMADTGQVDVIQAHPVIPRVSGDWRKQLRAVMGQQPSNQARRVRLESQHPMEDGVHFTNEWEHKVYVVLKERQAALPENQTIGIMPLGAMRVLGHTFEPDLLITYRGRVGVIEIDGPHHKGRASDDKSRERLLRKAGIKHIDRIDVRDSTQKPEVEKFVTDFLNHLVEG
jgi:hypothetical protein